MIRYARKLKSISRSEERRVGKGVDLGGRRIIKKSFFQAEDGIRDISIGDWSSDVCSSDLLTTRKKRAGISCWLIPALMMQSVFFYL